MIVTKKHLPRRTVLRGLGAALALPLLDSMVPALTAQRLTVASPITRLSVVYVPNGIVMRDWTPEAEGSRFELTPILQPLSPFRDQLTVLTGLDNGPPSYAVHAVASTEFLTTRPPALSTGSVVEAGISMDQLVAQTHARQTQLASLELSLDSSYAGTCDIGASCVYTDTVAWRNATTPLPTEHNPRGVFDRLFGEIDNTDPAVRARMFTQRRSILDSLGATMADLQRGLGPRDRDKIGQYFDAVRDVERRIQIAETQQATELPAVERPTGMPEMFPEHARLMFDLQVLAYQADLTRIITFMIGRELSGRTYPEIGVRDAHHPISHHRNDPKKLAMLTKVSTHHMSQFAYYLERLRATPDGDGSLLDHLTILYGCGMSDGNEHAQENLPLLLVGGGSGRLRGGRHLRVGPETPIANLHATLLPMLGVHQDGFGSSTGTLSGV